MKSIIDTDIVIIGAGIVGLSIARQLSSLGIEIVVIEKESKFGQHTSSRNSEVIHSGIYYSKDSLKHLLCIKGNKLLYDFCNNYDIPHKKCGKLILFQENQKETNNDYFEKAVKNGVDGFTLSDTIVLGLLKGYNFKFKNAFYCLDTGIVDSYELMYAIFNQCLKQNVHFEFNCEVKNVIFNNIHDNIFELHCDGFILRSKRLINCAGLGADKIADFLMPGKYKLEYWKGEYYKTNKIKNLKTLVYPVATDKSLGIHTKLNLDGSVSFGPNAYKVNQIDYSIDDRNRKDFIKSINEYLPDLMENDIEPDYCGIRPRLEGGTNQKDFIIQDETKNGFPGLINLIGIESPGLTCCFSIANMMVRMI